MPFRKQDKSIAKLHLHIIFGSSAQSHSSLCSIDIRAKSEAHMQLCF